MKKNSQEPVKVVLTYKSSSSEGNNVRSTAVTSTVARLDEIPSKLEENIQLVRRYSFDDNGGGYLGL